MYCVHLYYNKAQEFANLEKDCLNALISASTRPIYNFLNFFYTETFLLHGQRGLQPVEGHYRLNYFKEGDDLRSISFFLK